MGKCLLRLFVIVGIAAFSGSARAGAVENFLSGLGVLNFNAQGQRNFANGGHDLLINNNFQGNPLDFGLGRLTVQGPISLDVSTGRRGISMLDISFSTAINGNSTAIPLQYTLSTGGDAQAAMLNGTFLVDGDFSLNRLGFYNFDLTMSSTQTTTQNGNVIQTNNGNIGPIQVSGNIFADVFAAITAPFFSATGTANPLDAPSQSKVILGSTFNPTSQRFLGNIDILHDNGLSLFDVRQARTASGHSVGSAVVIVPEPTVLAFLLLGIPVILRQRLRRFLSASRQSLL